MNLLVWTDFSIALVPIAGIAQALELGGRHRHCTVVVRVSAPILCCLCDTRWRLFAIVPDAKTPRGKRSASARRLFGPRVGLF